MWCEKSMLTLADPYSYKQPRNLVPGAPRDSTHSPLAEDF